MGGAGESRWLLRMAGMRLYKLEMRIVVIGVAVEAGKPVYRRVARRGASCYIYVRAGSGVWMRT